MKAIFKALLLCLLAAPALAQEGPACRDLSFEETSFTVCEAALGDDIRLWLRDNAGALIGTPERLAQALAPDERLVFAMNAGMYSPDRSPVGLYIEDYQEKRVIVTSAGPGNFGMLPNGLFCLGETLAIYESRAFAKAPVRCRYATQSGPMLVIDGALHPKFIDGSDSLNIRNGVGVSADGRRAVFAISNEPVSFHRFARLFRDALGLPNALYLDGSISRLIAPELGRADIGLPMGPIIGVVAPR